MSFAPYLERLARYVFVTTPQHFLNLTPLPQGHGALRPTFSPRSGAVGFAAAAAVAAGTGRPLAS